MDCSFGYYLSKPNHKCHLCSEKIQGCHDCIRQSECLVCSKSFMLDQNSKQCNLCSETIEGCKYCYSDGKCEECLTGYFRISSGGCQRCSIANEGCIYCHNSTVCLQCESGYSLGLSTNLCQPCSNKCEICEENNPSICLTCNSQMFMSSPGQCTYCSSVLPGCLHC